MSIEEVQERYREALELIDAKRYKEAADILGRCMRILERIAEKSHGAEMLKAVTMLRNIGKLHAQLSRRIINHSEKTNNH